VKAIVTRPRAQAKPLVEALERAGIDVVECPLIEIERTSDEPVDGAGYDWLVVTSPNGADEIARRGRNLPPIAAVGPGTAETLRTHGIEPAFVPVSSSQDGLLREFPRPAGRVLFAAAEGARRRPIEELQADFVPLYRTRLLEPEPPAGDVVVLASGSAARAYAAIGGRAPAVTIGPETTRVARSVGLGVAAEAATHDIDGLGARCDGLGAHMSVVTFLTDFGLQDDFVGTCHGVIARVAPDVRVIDVTHGIEPQAVMQGAIVLRNTVPYLPVGVHLAVVDPGVGGTRRAIAVRARDGRMFVGPDNGLLMLAADEAGAESAHELIDPRYRLADVSRTFHARDIFAPAAAHLARGVEISELGPAIDLGDLVRIDVPEPVVGRTQISTTVLVIDRFGNVATNAKREHVAALGVSAGDRLEIRLTLDRYFALLADTFADAGPGELLLYEDSYGLMTLAISRGDAAGLTGVAAGSELRIAVT
jgi:hypothetical protein